MKIKIPAALLKYFQPRSSDPEVAFRERTIRITVVLLILLLTLAILTNLLIFQDFRKGEYSYLVFMIVTDVLMIASLVALEQKKILVAGWILAVAFVEILVSFTLMNGYWDV